MFSIDFDMLGLMEDFYLGYVEDNPGEDNLFDSEELDFDSLIEDSFTDSSKMEGQIVKGTVLSINDGKVILDVGLKSEGVVPLSEFTSPAGDVNVKVGDVVDVYVERYENRRGEVVVNREKAMQYSRWDDLEKLMEQDEVIECTVTGVVKGGFLVDLGAVNAFLPGSQAGFRSFKDRENAQTALIGTSLEMKILKMDRVRGNIVVSHRAVLDMRRKESQKELFDRLDEAKAAGKSLKLDGVVKSLVNYGAFVDLGNVDALLYLSDISWNRIKHPSDVLTIGQDIEVIVKDFDRESGRIALKPANMEGDPWQNIEEKYQVGSRVKGVVVNIKDYGAFIGLAEGIDALLHISEMSWNGQGRKVSEFVSVGDEVEVQILGVGDRKISVGLKQCMENPLTKFCETHSVGDVVECKVIGIEPLFGLHVKINDDINGTVHKSDLSWTQSRDDALKSFKIGEDHSFKIVKIDEASGVIKLSMKQMRQDPFKEKIGDYQVGQKITCDVGKVLDNGIEVNCADGGIRGFVHRSDLSRDRIDQKTSNFEVGDKVDVKITGIYPERSKVTLSIKELQLDEEREALKIYGSSGKSGAQLAGILGDAIKKTEEKNNKAT
jgi:small subunit ribosomal protein S1